MVVLCQREDFFLSICTHRENFSTRELSSCSGCVKKTVVTIRSAIRISIEEGAELSDIVLNSFNR